MDKRLVVFRDAVLGEDVAGVAGDQQAAKSGQDLAGAFQEHGPGHLRHDHIGDQQLDRRALLAKNIESLQRRGRGKDFVADGLQHPPGRGEHRLFVVDEQDVLAAAALDSDLDTVDGTRGGVGVFGRDQWEIEFEGRSGTHGAGDDDAAIAGLHRAVDRCESKAGPLALGLRREERFEESAQLVRRNAGAIVRNGDHGVAARGQDSRGGHDFPFGLSDQGAQGDPAIGTHADRVAGVDAEIGQRLVELARIDLDAVVEVWQGEFECDVLPDDPLQERRRGRDGLGNADDLGFEFRLAGEDEKLLREFGRAPRGVAHREDVGLNRMGIAKLHQGHFRIAEDRLQHVVEIVGDAAGEQANGFHLGHLRDLAAQLLALVGVLKLLRDVPPDDEKADDRAGGVADRRHRDALLERRAVHADALHLGLPDVALEQRLPHRMVPLGVGGRQRKERHRAPEGLGGRAARQDRGARVHVFDDAVGVGDENGLAGLVHRHRETRPGLLGPPALRDVEDEALHGLARAGLALNRRARIENPAARAVLVHDGVFKMAGSAGGHELLPGVPQRFDGRGIDHALVADAARQELVGRMAAEIEGALGHEFELPAAFHGIPVHHAGHVRDERGVLAPAFPKRTLGFDAFEGLSDLRAERLDHRDDVLRECARRPAVHFEHADDRAVHADRGEHHGGESGMIAGADAGVANRLGEIVREVVDPGRPVRRPLPTFRSQTREHEPAEATQVAATALAGGLRFEGNRVFRREERRVIACRGDKGKAPAPVHADAHGVDAGLPLDELGQTTEQRIEVLRFGEELHRGHGEMRVFLAHLLERDVSQDPSDHAASARLIPEMAERDLDVQALAGGADEHRVNRPDRRLVGALPRSAVPDHAAKLGQNGFFILEDAHVGQRPPDQIRRMQAETDSGDRRTHIREAKRLRIHLQEDVAHVLHKRSILALAHHQRHLRLVRLGDVGARHVPEGVARDAIASGMEGAGEPANLAVFAKEGVALRPGDARRRQHLVHDGRAGAGRGQQRLEGQRVRLGGRVSENDQNRLADLRDHASGGDAHGDGPAVPGHPLVHRHRLGQRSRSLLDEGQQGILTQADRVDDQGQQHRDDDAHAEHHQRGVRAVGRKKSFVGMHPEIVQVSKT